MEVEIWSDVVCPWCYVGTVRFERAVAETGIDVDVVYRSFELDPSVRTGAAGPPLVDYLTAKFGDRSRVQAAHARLASAGAELGIDFRWSCMRRANTFDAHRLLACAHATAGPEQQPQLKSAPSPTALGARRPHLTPRDPAASRDEKRHLKPQERDRRRCGRHTPRSCGLT